MSAAAPRPLPAAIAFGCVVLASTHVASALWLVTGAPGDSAYDLLEGGLFFASVSMAMGWTLGARTSSRPLSTLAQVGTWLALVTILLAGMALDHDSPALGQLSGVAEVMLAAMALAGAALWRRSIGRRSSKALVLAVFGLAAQLLAMAPSRQPTSAIELFVVVGLLPAADWLVVAWQLMSLRKLAEGVPAATVVRVNTVNGRPNTRP